MRSVGAVPLHAIDLGRMIDSPGLGSKRAATVAFRTDVLRSSGSALPQPRHSASATVRTPSAAVERRENIAGQQRRLAREAELIAEADADSAAGRLINAAEVDAWIEIIGTDPDAGRATGARQRTTDELNFIASAAPGGLLTR